jgi:hypothetical protein
MNLSCTDCGPEGGVAYRDGIPRCASCAQPLGGRNSRGSATAQTGTTLRLVHEATKTLIALPESGTLAIGREGSPLAGLLASDLGISRRHAEIVASSGGYLLRHIASNNQTELLAPSPRTQRTLLAPGASERLEVGHRIRLQTHFLLVEAVPLPPRKPEPSPTGQTAEPKDKPLPQRADEQPQASPPPPPVVDPSAGICRNCRYSQDVTGQVDAFGVWVCDNCSAENQVAVAR